MEVKVTVLLLPPTGRDTHLNLWLVVTWTACCTWLHTFEGRPPAGGVLAWDTVHSNKHMNKSNRAEQEEEKCFRAL